jgi:DNA-binding transcriptional LysR family regulator
MNWDDLRIITAVRNEGTYAAAGARLRIDETTVSRRLARIERVLEITLFEAIDGVRRPTPDCDASLRTLTRCPATSRRSELRASELWGQSGGFELRAPMRSLRRCWLLESRSFCFRTRD